jgi:hypothetical protein
MVGGMFRSQHPNYPYFLYDMKDKALLHNSIKQVLDTGAQRLFTGHGGPLSNVVVERWLTEQSKLVEVR